MSAETAIIDVPVYRLTFECHEAAVRKRVERLLGDIIDNPSVHEHLVEEERQRIREEKVAPWQFNEIVGWVRIYALGTQVRGEYYFATGKKLCLAPQKRIILLRGVAFQLGFSPEATNAEIGILVIESVKMLRNDRPFKRRYIDLACLETLCKHFDWRRVLFDS